MEERRYTIVFFLLAAVLVGSLVFSYKTYVRVRDVERGYVPALRGEINRLNGQIRILSSRLDKLNERRGVNAASDEFGFNDGPTVESAGGAGPRPAAGARNGSKEDLSTAEDSRLSMDSQGEGYYPRSASEYTKQVQEKRDTLMQSDRQKYGDSVSSLYKAAVTGRDTTEGRQKSDMAFSQLVQEYPQSYAAASAVAERALQAARQGNIQEVEGYYKVLTSNENFQAAVTQNGVEAVPAINSYLANKYIQEGRIDDAKSIVQYLQQNYGQSYMSVPGQQGTPEVRPMTDVIDRLNNTIASGDKGQNAQNAQNPQGPPGSGPPPKQ